MCARVKLARLVCTNLFSHVVGDRAKPGSRVSPKKQKRKEVSYDTMLSISIVEESRITHPT